MRWTALLLLPLGCAGAALRSANIPQVAVTADLAASSRVRRLAPAATATAAIASVAAHHKSKCRACCACAAIQAEDAALQKDTSDAERCTVGRCAEEGSHDLWWCWDSYTPADMSGKWGSDCKATPGFPACSSAACDFRLTAGSQAKDTIGEFATWDHDKHLSFGPKTGGPDLPGGDDDDAEE